MENTTKMKAENLYKENERLAFFVLNRHFPMLAHDDDYIQEARMALWKACMNFDESKGYTFSSYACATIHKNVLGVWYKKKRESERAKDVMSLQQPFGGEGFDIALSDVLGEEDQSLNSVDIDAALRKVLDDAELEICQHLLNGKTQVEIAATQGIPKHRVAASVRSIRRKLLRSDIIF